MNIFHPREKFLIVEVLPQKVNGLLLVLDSEKRLRAKKFYEGTTFPKIGVGENVIVAADSALAFTSVARLGFPREHPDKPLNAHEFESLLSRGIGRVFNHCRREAAHELHVEDLEVVPARGEASHFLVDRHRVVSPIGFRGRRIEFVIELILTTRGALDRVKSALPARKGFFFTTTDRALLLSLGKVVNSPVKLLSLRAPSSHFSVMEDAGVGYAFERAECRWPSSRFVDLIAGHFGVGEEAARNIYGVFFKGEVSPDVGRILERLVRHGCTELLDEVQKAKFSGRIYLDYVDTPPFQRPHRERGVLLDELPLHALLSRLGVRLTLAEWPITENQIFRRLSPFFEYYTRKEDAMVERWLRRHLAWLGAGA